MTSEIKWKLKLLIALHPTICLQCVYMRSEPAHLGGISPDFAGIPPRRDESFPYERAQVGQPGKVG